ncbi:tRNA (adenosine(37)-N6)-threonylcarbamoyltransferase complex dimerization subunit type 1 TsaB [Selenomonas timonae]|uniref:tRNA (Adenosine(37)-N6)-threonylcarbamoyltransferase complex dimerization subunit type 1 TsaB n=1 Tax=Selenomonas timonae TaxID=2754044 RepID=A0A7G7VHP7_9FIRM|nr:tRNA (adenosine(37)-N6)-threonylcarbamoyltransferase complex dimerization subunit type 1 TsaB [Selenomonas timonae]QNH53640.1 tRNA (adenosine(37)-N6)-threonylcarbamoyltransferase complex dimerization subunit type 1 TsaB [Selenomonas timonae]
MSILSIDTSSQVSSVAVLSVERVAAEISMQGALTHSETLMPHIEMALRMARVEKSELEGIAVSIGPGSFTGLRIGLASAKMMAYALHIPLIAVPTLEALAHHYICEGVRLVPMMDAQKGNVYAQEFVWRMDGDALKLQEIRPLAILPLTEVIAGLENAEQPVILLGDAMQKKTTLTLPANVRLAPIHARMPRAACVGLAALTRLARGEMDDPVTAAPLYLRRSEAEVLWEKRHGTGAAQ